MAITQAAPDVEALWSELAQCERDFTIWARGHDSVYAETRARQLRRMLFEHSVNAKVE